jgi:hypothetical protein
MPEIYNPNEAATKDLFKDQEGFIIPDYQRPYSWKSENITQLFEDICSEAIDYTDAFEQEDGNERNAIRFLGTLIQIKQEGSLFTERYPNATPNYVISVVDGQQRISTIILTFLTLYCKLVELAETLGEDEISKKLKGIIERKNREILNIISIELNGKPQRKPRIIRAMLDSWTYDGSVDMHYKSGPAQAVALLLQMLEDENKTELHFIIENVKEELVKKNLSYIKDIIHEIMNCHLDDKSNPTIGDAEIPFPTATRIAGLGNKLNGVWYAPNPDLTNIVLNQQDHAYHKKIAITLQSMYFCYFLMQRCYFVSIVAPDEDRAFDMFQSLNTSGTPLTAIETFRPIVARELDATSRQAMETYFKRILNYIDSIDDNSSTADLKLRATNNLLSHFAYMNSGFLLSKTFSNQRRWLQKKFGEATIIRDKEQFIGRIADVAEFLHALHRVKKGTITELDHLDKLNDLDRQLATFNTVFLDDAGNELGKTILACYYSRVISDKPNSQEDFLQVTKIVVAFFVLWRSASTNAKLDDAYRRALIGETDAETKNKKYKGICWDDTQDNLTVEMLRSILLDGLKRKRLNEKELWFNNAKARLNYEDAKTICKFVLLLTSYNREPSKLTLGLLGDVVRTDSEDRLTASYYKARKHHTLEHVAPDSQTSEWDSTIYADQIKHSIGNLTLLPISVNSEVGNKSWKYKWIYFWQVGSSSIGNPADVKAKASSLGIAIDDKIVGRLAKTEEYIRVNAPLASMDPTRDQWNRDLIEKRRDQILELTWDILSQWLGIIS